MGKVYTIKKARKELLGMLRARYNASQLYVKVFRIEFELPLDKRFTLSDILKVFAKLTGDSEPLSIVYNPDELEYLYAGAEMTIRNHREGGTPVTEGSWNHLKIVLYNGKHNITAYAD